jgi:hypothetical protein
MRDLLNLLDQALTESVGLANRQPGSRFANEQGDELVFNSVSFYPEAGAYATSQELTAAIADIAQQLTISPGSIVWSNPARGARAFGLAHFTDIDGRDVYIGRYLQNISANRNENKFPNDLPGGYRLRSQAAEKERSGYKPTDVLTRLDNLTPDDVLSQVTAKFGEGSDEAVAMQTFMSATKFPVMIPRGNMNFLAFTNYFCEMMQPMALVMGKPTKGNAAEAESKFMPNSGFETCTITFGGGKTVGLTDSTLINPRGQSIGVSSKAKAGAKASAGNLNDKIKEMQGTPAGQDLLDSYPEAVEILQMITEGGYINGPLDLAVEFKIIDPTEAAQVVALRKLGPQEVVGRGLLSSRLEKMYQDRRSKDPSKIVPFYHMLAAVAYRVADYINKNTDFPQAASAILNYGAFIQVYTYASQKGDMIALDQFEVKFPSEAVTDVLIAADKTYYSNGNKGNFTFQILKNGATADQVEIQDSEVDVPAARATPPTAQDLDQITQRRSEVRAAKAVTEPGIKALGRKRQR